MVIRESFFQENELQDGLESGMAKERKTKRILEMTAIDNFTGKAVIVAAN
jgi:hypothetical protein